MTAAVATGVRSSCYAVIFSSQRGDEDHAYDKTAQQMLELAREQPGFLAIESARNAEGFGITVSYWRDEVAIAAWKAQVDHVQARARGRSDWYVEYAVRVARVERAYGGGKEQLA